MAYIFTRDMKFVFKLDSVPTILSRIVEPDVHYEHWKMREECTSSSKVKSESAFFRDSAPAAILLPQAPLVFTETNTLTSLMKPQLNQRHLACVQTLVSGD